jgi:Flp pilus assembly protein TadD
MYQPLGRQLSPSAPNLHSRVDASGGVQPTNPTRIERNANTCATDWQIILHLRSLFESNPALISTLMADASANAPAGYAETLLVAAKEALAERPGSVDLHLHTAAAAARCGRIIVAESVLRQLLAIDPDHAKARAMLADVSASTLNTEGDTEAAEASSHNVGEIVQPTFGRRGGRGNELPS